MRKLSFVLFLAAAGLGTACADPIEAPDASVDAGVAPTDASEPADTGLPPDDAGAPVDAGEPEDAGGARRIQARGLVPVLGVSANDRRTVRGRVNSPTVGTASGPNHMVRTTPAPR
jgi:hypothetical protein